MLINLHTHLCGCVRPATAAEFAQQDGMDEPDGGWEAALTLAGPADLTVFLRKVAAAYPFFGTPERIARIACEAVEDAAADGCDYLELRFGPATHVRDHQDLDTVIRAVCDGMAEGTRRTGLAAGAVVATLRHHDDETGVAVARAAARHAGDGIVGFDLAGDELLYPDLGRYVDAFGIASAAGLGLTCHAAEAAPAAAAREAVAVLGATRIGHGAHMIDDPDTLAWAAGEGIVVEVCPTSNWLTGAIGSIHDHPARAFHDAGVPLVLGDDDPTTTRSRLGAERRIMKEQLGFDDTALAALDTVSIRAAFAEASVRTELARKCSSAVGHDR